MTRETESLQKVGAETIVFLRSLTGRDLPAYLVASARLHADRLALRLPRDNETLTIAPAPKARPIFETLNALSLAALAVGLILAGADGRPVYVPAWFLVGVGCCLVFTASCAAMLCWQHWRLRAALRDLAKAQRRVAEQVAIGALSPNEARAQLNAKRESGL